MQRRDDEHGGVRHLRLQELMLSELRGLLRDDVTDPALTGVRINALVLSVDYRHARVHFAIRDATRTELTERTEDEARARRAEVERAFTRASPFLRARLAEAVETKRVPDLRFVFDAESADDVGEDDS